MLFSGANEKKIWFGGLQGKVTFEWVFIYFSTASNISLSIERSGVELVRLTEVRHTA